MPLAELGIAAGTALLGALAGGKGKSSTSSSEPWKVQQPYLRAGMADAANIYAQQRGTPTFGGRTYAQTNPHTNQALAGIYGYNAQGNRNANTLTGTGAQLSNYGTSGIQGAAGALAGFNPQDPTQQNIHNAGLYANNPALDGAIAAASRDVTRNLSEVQLPGIARGADANGNLNSTRTSIAEGIAMRGAQDQIGDIASNMRYDAYNNGLNLAEQARTTNQGDWLNAQNQAGALSGQMVNQGYNGIATGQGLYYDNKDAQAAAGAIQQANQQGILDERFQQWQRNDQRPWELLNKYQGAITGAGSYPSTTSSSGGGWQGALQGAMGGAAAGLGLYGSYKNLNQTNAIPQNNSTSFGGFR